MTDMEAAIGRIQLKKLDRYIKKRRRNAKIYKQELHGLVEFQSEPDYAEHAYFFFGVLTDLDNDKLSTLGYQIDGDKSKCSHTAIKPTDKDDNFLYAFDFRISSEGKVLKTASYKLPIKTKIVTRAELNIPC